MHTLSLTPAPPPAPLYVYSLDVAWQVTTPRPFAVTSRPFAVPASQFLPTEFQAELLDALRGKSLRTNGLAAKLSCSTSRLFQRPGGIPELIDHGLMAHHKRIGYYRPDALPPELQRPAA